MTGRDLEENLNYTGMERDVRKLALNDKLASSEEFATMSLLEVCDLVSKKYDIAFVEDENIGLIEKNKLKEYKKMIKYISR